ncbi:hypothetical protein BGLA2_1890026 [Burkholderia gladioli]|nr:hypothetical protein BGLA2_1890026 [Burkholderia gladioli]
MCFPGRQASAARATHLPPPGAARRRSRFESLAAAPQGLSQVLVRQGKYPPRPPSGTNPAPV